MGEGLDSRTRILTKHVKEIDPKLYAVRGHNGAIHIYRTGTRWALYSWDNMNLFYAEPSPHLVLSLTDNWRPDGEPIDLGIEPLRQELRELDSWRTGPRYEERKKNREAREELLERRKKNEIRARATDMRKDFARAFT